MENDLEVFHRCPHVEHVCLPQNLVSNLGLGLTYAGEAGEKGKGTRHSEGQCCEAPPTVAIHSPSRIVEKRRESVFRNCGHLLPPAIGPEGPSETELPRPSLDFTHSGCQSRT